MDRNNCSLCHHLSLSEKLPPDLKVKLAAANGVRHSAFDLLEQTCTSKRGEDRKKCFAAVLSVSAAGKFLPTMAVFKKKT